VVCIADLDSNERAAECIEESLVSGTKNFSYELYGYVTDLVVSIELLKG